MSLGIGVATRTLGMVGGEFQDFFREKDHLLGGGQGLKGCGTCAPNLRRPPSQRVHCSWSQRTRRTRAITDHRAGVTASIRSAGPWGLPGRGVLTPEIICQVNVGRLGDAIMSWRRAELRLGQRSATLPSPSPVSSSHLFPRQHAPCLLRLVGCPLSYCWPRPPPSTQSVYFALLANCTFL